MINSKNQKENSAFYYSYCIFYFLAQYIIIMNIVRNNCKTTIVLFLDKYCAFPKDPLEPIDFFTIS